MNKWKENTNKYIRKLILTKVGTWNWLRLARDLSMLCGTGGSNSGSKKKYQVKPCKQVLENTAAKLNFIHDKIKVVLNS
jgi:hypothetical protein